MNYYFKIIEGKSAEELESNLEEYMSDRQDQDIKEFDPAIADSNTFKPNNTLISKGIEFVTINFNVAGGIWRALVTLRK